MTYKLEPWVGKISSSVIVTFPDGTSRRYVGGGAVVDDVFECHYVVDKIAAVSGEIALILKNVEIAGSNWIGEEQSEF